MNCNSQTRMTNDEIRRNDEIRMTKPATAQLRAFGHSGFGFLSTFDIRHSTFNDLRKTGSWSQRALKKASGLSKNRPFVLAVVLDLVLDWVAWIRGRGRRARGRSGSWSQCMRKKAEGLSMNQPLPVSWPDRSSGPRPVPGRSV